MKNLNTAQLLRAVLYALNKIPNSGIRGCPHGFHNTYQLAGAVDERIRLDELDRTLAKVATEEAEKTKTFTANGCWGELHCDPVTGNVVRYERGGDWEKEGDGYDDITRLDVDEWRAYWPGGDLFAGHDILDFGSWDKNGRYVGPEIDWRNEILHDRPDLARQRAQPRVATVLLDPPWRAWRGDK